jgi:hypothetical protein
MGRSPDIETAFQKKHGVFLKILQQAGHPTLRPFFRKKKHGVFLKNLTTGRSPDIETIF